jgi:ABC-type nitrate/sulfonate/bicarbonate transport system substrate-binding protein
MDRITFPYRSATHLPLLHVIAESGAWEKQGLEVDYNRPISSSEAHAAVTSGDIDFVGGNHVSTYGRRARGDDWVYLGQTVNYVPGRTLIVRSDSGINGMADLRRKTVGTVGHHPGLNDWLFLKQHGLDVDRDEVELVQQKFSPTIDKANFMAEAPLWHLVRDKVVDAVFICPPGTTQAEQAGLKLIEIEPMPMIYFTTISTSMRLAEQRPELVERFLKGVIEGIHFFKTQPARSIDVIRNRYANEGILDETMAALTYKCLADAFEPKLYPTPQAIANVYVEGVRQDKDAARMTPMELWDLHFIRRIDDSGFVDQLYSK